MGWWCFRFFVRLRAAPYSRHFPRYASRTRVSQWSVVCTCDFTASIFRLLRSCSGVVVGGAAMLCRCRCRCGSRYLLLLFSTAATPPTTTTTTLQEDRTPARALSLSSTCCCCCRDCLSWIPIFGGSGVTSSLVVSSWRISQPTEILSHPNLNLNLNTPTSLVALAPQQPPLPYRLSTSL